MIKGKLYCQFDLLIQVFSTFLFLLILLLYVLCAVSMNLISLKISRTTTKQKQIFFCLFSVSSSLIAMIQGDFMTRQPLLNTQKDLRLALSMSELIDHPLPLTATANEMFKHAKRIGYGEHDAGAIYINSKL